MNELTYSLTADDSHPVFAGKLGESYQRIHAAIAQALATFGVEATIRGRDTVLDSERDDTGMCFHKSSCEDLVWGARKGVGSAQRRKNGRVLHHGSIKLGTTPLEGEIATVGQIAGKIDPSKVAEAVRHAFAEQLEMQFEIAVPTPAERHHAHVLGSRYLDPEFVRRR